ncbi:MAG: aminotransferase class I/II-fold pyridoxal phosphate-dependent enzyme [Acidobacteria bacterium]|nr:aminotransferase class I/II-fold pyridoxal phosphate-dependent enzyme [Acidobacteriota bacterium]
MKIKKLLMEDWLADYQFVKYNLAESGFVDFSLGEFMALCKADPPVLAGINLANPDTHGSMGLRREIVKCYRELKVENVLVTVGVTEALFSFFNTILGPDDEVIVEFPEFQTLYELPAALGCRIKYLYLSKENGFRPEPGKLRQLISPRTKLIIINNPHNPSGSLIDSETIKEIGQIALENNCYLLFDEHYKFLPLTEGTELLTSGFDICSGFHKKVAAVGSITKCFGLNGLRVGWLLADAQVIEECREFKHYLTHVTPPLCDYLAELALRNKETVLGYVKDNILKNVRLLNDFMATHEHRFEYLAPKGGLVCFPRLKDQTDALPFCREMLEKYRVSLLPGEAFDMPAHFRLNFGIKADIFASALEFLKE